MFKFFQSIFKVRYFKEFLGCLIILTSCVVPRLYTMNEPFDRDLTTYLVISKSLLDGRNLYSDLWDHKPPGIFLIWAIAIKIFGYSNLTVLIVNSAVTIWIAALLKNICQRWGSYLSWLAVGLWVFLSMDLSTESNQPNQECFISLGLLLIINQALKIIGGSFDKSKLKQAVLQCSLGAMLCTLMKPNVIVVLFILSLGLLIECRKNQIKTNLSKSLLSYVVATCAVLWSCVVFYFYFVGRINDFWLATVIHAASYPGNLWKSVLKPFFYPEYLLPNYLWALAPLFLISFWSLYKGLKEKFMFAIILSMWVISTQIMIASPGRFFPHYYQLWIPILAVLVPYSLHLQSQMPSLKRFIPIQVVALVLILTLRILPQFQLTPEEWSVKKYGSWYKDTLVVANYLNKELGSGDTSTFYEWGSETGLYYYTKKSPPSGVLFVAHLDSQVVGKYLTERSLDQIKTKKPDLFVINQHEAYRISNPILDWIKDNYCPAEAGIPGTESYRIWKSCGLLNSTSTIVK